MLVIGDFDDIASPSEKFGGRPPSRRKMEPFLDFLGKTNLIDIGFSSPNSLIRTRVDRAHANAEWLNLFSETQITHQPSLTSDHCPILLQTSQNINRGPKPFRFEPFWMKHSTFTKATSRVWQTDQRNLSQTISHYQLEISKCNKENFGNIFQEIKRTKARLYGLQKNIQYCANSQLLNLERKLQNKIKELLEYEESLWKMKSRINWLSLGDKYIVFFHMFTIIKRSNKILKLLKPDQT